jgi:hypothetical protein
MKELRPLGSEKLIGDAKIQRILEIANYGRTPKPTNVDKPEFVTESKIGGVYGIVKEKDGFYVKTGLNENTLEYIGGMFMKNKNRFHSYGEAYKRLEFLKGQDTLQEAVKYVLKKPAPPMESAPADPSMSEPPSPSSEIPPVPTGEEPAPEQEMPVDGEQDPNLRSGYMGEIQKYAGKLGQELRDQKDRLESDDIKYTLNMIISAMDLDKLDDDDLDEIADKFDRDDEEFDDQGGGGSDDFSNEPPAPEGDEELAEVTGEEGYDQRYEDEDDLDETMSKLDEFIHSNVGEDDDLFSKYANIGKDEQDMDEYNYSGEEEVPTPEVPRQPRFRTKPPEQHSNNREIDIDEITNAVNNAIRSSLSKYK